MKIYISALLLSPHTSRRKNENKSENVGRSLNDHDFSIWIIVRNRRNVTTYKTGENSSDFAEFSMAETIMLIGVCNMYNSGYKWRFALFL